MPLPPLNFNSTATAGDAGNGATWNMGNGWDVNIGSGSASSSPLAALGAASPLIPLVLIAGVAWLLLKR